MTLALIFILVLINSFAQILLKIGATKVGKKVFFLRISPETIFGYLLFFIATLLSVYLLKFIEFKSLTLVIALNYVGTLVFSNLILKEKYTKIKVISTILIIAGVIVFNI
ncbi:EamA family transporter [Paenibacillus sp. NRS-1760]|uniref:EamA family transporter n=1 Tax=Paenibacillus sp. NRS-1760 TaxID=3233902 RepID=UPI003D2711D9